MTDSAAFDMGAAWLRRSQGDTRAFLEGLAARLEGALPGSVKVQRARDGLFSGRTHVSAVTVSLTGAQYELTARQGGLQGRRARIVRGVVISSAELQIPAWLDALGADMQALGGQASAASAALHDFLLS